MKLLTLLRSNSPQVRIFRVFRCNRFDPNPTYYLEADMNVECFVGEHSNAMSWAVFCIFVYVIGIPLWMFYMLWQHSEDIAKINNDNDMKLKAFVHFYKHEAKSTTTKELVILKYDYQLHERELKKTLKRTKAAVHVTWCDNIKWLFCFWNKTFAQKSCF